MKKYLQYLLTGVKYSLVSIVVSFINFLAYKLFDAFQIMSFIKTDGKLGYAITGILAIYFIVSTIAFTGLLSYLFWKWK